MIRVGILDDHPMVLWGIERALRDCASIQVTNTASSPCALEVSDIDVLLHDVYLGGDLPSAASVARFSLYTKIIMMSATRNFAAIDECIGAGASGFIHKSAPRDEIVRAIRTVATGGLVQEPVRRPEPASADAHGLSPRERQVITMIGSGLTHEQIARRIGVSKHTVDTYIKRVRAKLNLGNKAELARLAHRLSASGGVPR